MHFGFMDPPHMAKGPLAARMEAFAQGWINTCPGRTLGG